MKYSTRFASLAAAMLMAAGSMAALYNPAATVVAPAGTRAERRQRNALGGARPTRRRRGPGWTNKHVQRMASKKRNVSRNRSAHRG